MQLKMSRLAVVAYLVAAGVEASAATVGGTVTIPTSDMGWQATRDGMKVRVEGTTITANVDYNTGSFSLSDVPAGAVTLLLVENQQDVFTAASKRLPVQVNGDVSGVEFSLAYHWKTIGYPTIWGQGGYSTWTAQFVSDQVAFMLFNMSNVSPQRLDLYRTLDGGQNWSLILSWTYPSSNYGSELHPDRSNLSFYFLDADHGVVHAAVGDGGVGFYQTTDGGQNWNYVGLPGISGAYPQNIDRYAQVGTDRLLVAGNLGAHVQGYGGTFQQIIWESPDAGATWQIATSWEADIGGCTALGAGPDGSAVAFYTSYGYGSHNVAVRDATAGTWTVTTNGDLVVNSGYGPADLAFTGRTAWVRGQGTLPNGFYRNDLAGANGAWTFVSEMAVQYFSMGSELRGFGTAGGPMYATYDGGVTWLYQASGGGLCCHGNDVWAFDATHAAWHDGGVGDPDGTKALSTYVEPWTPDFEVVSGVTLPDSVQQAGDLNVPIASLKLVNQGPVPITVNSLLLHGSAAGSDLGQVTAVKLWLDANGAGSAVSGATLLGQGVFSSGTVSLATGGLVLNQYVPVYVLVTYDLANGPINGVFTGTVLASEVGAVQSGNSASVIATAPTGYALNARNITLGTGAASPDTPDSGNLDAVDEPGDGSTPTTGDTTGDEVLGETSDPPPSSSVGMCGSGLTEATLLSGLMLWFANRRRTK